MRQRKEIAPYNCKHHGLVNPYTYTSWSSRNNRNELRRECPICKKSSDKKYRENHQEKISEYLREYAKSHKEKVNEYNKKSYWKNHEKQLDRHKKYRDDNTDVCTEIGRIWRENNPEKHEAHKRLNIAVRSGKITRKNCEVCGEEKTHAHHNDYSKPLEVMWLCPKHHKEIHKEAKNVWSNCRR